MTGKSVLVTGVTGVTGGIGKATAPARAAVLLGATS